MVEEAEGIPPIDFTTFVLSMSTACMGHLSNTEDPNLPMARQTLEILELIEKKTGGNLTGEEERILTQVLADLRDALEKA
ncbi:MAG: DUF1844 domain-containing protein [Sandaracinaceae bacterium]